MHLLMCVRGIGKFSSIRSMHAAGHEHTWQHQHCAQRAHCACCRASAHVWHQHCPQHSHSACCRSCTTEGGNDDLKKGTQLLEIYALEIQVESMLVQELHRAVPDIY